MHMKEAYQEKIEAQLREWAVAIDHLKARADEGRDRATSAYYEQLELLRQKQVTAQQRLEELQRGGEDAWEHLKQGMEQAWHDLKQAIDAARATLP
jgi:hypothetical protein